MDPIGYILPFFIAGVEKTITELPTARRGPVMRAICDSWTERCCFALPGGSDVERPMFWVRKVENIQKSGEGRFRDELDFIFEKIWGDFNNIFMKYGCILLYVGLRYLYL